MRISEAGLPAHKKLRMGLNKSTVLEVPRHLQDVLISDPSVVDAVVQTSNRIFLLAKKSGVANAFFFDNQGQQFLTLELYVERDASGLEGMLNRLLPGSNIKIEMINEAVVLNGSVRTPVDAARAVQIATQFVAVEITQQSAAGTTGNTDVRASASDAKAKVINLLAIEGEDQVMLRVTMAEVQRSLMKQMGINLGAQLTSGNFSTTLLTANALPLTAAAGLGSLPIPGINTSTSGGTICGGGSLCNYNPGPGSSAFGNSGLSGGFGTSDARVTQAMRALERDGLVKTLAEPNLTAVSGETAKFLAGGEYPVPVVDTTGALSVTYKEFGVSLSFTPVVLSEGRISLKIETEVSELSNNGAVTLSNISIPALKKRQAKSTVELPSGGSLAMAGLISDNLRQNIDGFPGLKDLPVLGTLFRSRDFIKEETELVVIVTPYLVRPSARSALARPDDGLAAATDMKANFLGHLNKIYGKGTAMPDGGLKGDYGFIVE
ncbi:MAG: type II and III secretion system protein family protein, partial [Hyphomicrobiaceae bacterium]